MIKYMSICVESGVIETKGDTKAEVIEKLSINLGQKEHGKGEFYIVEVVDSLTISTKQVVQTSIINADGKEVKIDARDRVIPTERTRGESASIEEEVEDILSRVE